MYRAIFAVLLLAIIFNGCTAPGPGNTASDMGKGSVEDLTDDEDVEAPVKERFERDIGDSKGVVTLSEKYGEDDTVKIYNADGSMWYEFSYYDESAFDQLESINTDFRPFAFHPDFLILGLRVVGEDDKRYEVVVNEEDGLKKFVLKNDEDLEFEPFDKHIVSTYAVDFDPSKNPVLKEPGGEKVDEDYSKVPLFKAVKVGGDWVEIKWNSPDAGGASSNTNVPGEGTEKTGWVRWRDGSKMTIELFYVE